MKTISITESAYQRLASWKEGRTFSQVIEQMIPLKGMIEAAFEAVGNLPDLSAKDCDKLEKAANAARQPLPAAWS
jgi:predicted CopG family antitoxin